MVSSSKFVSVVMMMGFCGGGENQGCTCNDACSDKTGRYQFFEVFWYDIRDAVMAFHEPES